MIRHIPAFSFPWHPFSLVRVTKRQKQCIDPRRGTWADAHVLSKSLSSQDLAQLPSQDRWIKLKIELTLFWVPKICQKKPKVNNDKFLKKTSASPWNRLRGWFNRLFCRWFYCSYIAWMTWIKFLGFELKCLNILHINTLLKRYLNEICILTCPITCMNPYIANIHLATLILPLRFLSCIVKSRGNTVCTNDNVILML